MARRFITLAPLAPALAVIAFAAAHAAAGGVTAERNRLEDVQVGAAGRLLRVALICRNDCHVLARAGGEFYLQGVEAALSVDISDRTTLASGLDFSIADGGTILRIKAAHTPQKASVKPCRIDGARASCIDLEFSGPDAARPQTIAAARAPGQAEKTPSQPKTPPLGGRGEAIEKPVAPAGKEPSLAQSAPPALREAPDATLLTFARFAPPERLAPPTASSTARGSGPPPASAAAGRPSIIDKTRAEQLLGEKFDFAAKATDILGRSFDSGECAAAKSQLAADAWNLEAMVDVGFCAAIAGDLEKADDLFARLLAYTPDNYEALVGRALIAAKAGEKSVARKYFQDALNAAPPIAASGRIVEAMTGL
ncbi:MAG: hypothetical protein GC153_09120 [Alphaproteobacteria bacterium]|nr:hypothetical protein [Alphaproteobacteria bacterium]